MITEETVTTHEPQFGQVCTSDQAIGYAKLKAERNELLEACKKANEMLYATGAPLGSDNYLNIRNVLSTAITSVKGWN